jgi:hypothetical protein
MCSVCNARHVDLITKLNGMTHQSVAYQNQAFSC